MREALKKVGGQTGWQLFGKLITSLSTLFLISILSRNYGEEGVGLYSLAVTYLAFFYLAGDLGLNAYGLRFVEKNPVIFQKIFGFRIVNSFLLVMFACLGAAAFLFSDNASVFIAIVSGVLSIIGNSIFVSSNLIFQSKFRYDLSIISSILSALSTLLFIWLFIQFNVPLPYLIIAHSLSWFLAAGVSLLFIKRYVSLTPLYSLSFSFEMLRNNWPVSITLLLNVVYFRVDTFILSFTRNIAEVGVYNLAYQFFSNALVFPTFIMNALYPLFLKTHDKSRSMLFPFLLKSSFIMGSLGLLGSVVTYFLAPFVIALVAGEGLFEGSVESLRILSYSFPAFFLSAVFMWGLVTVDRSKQMLWIYLFGLGLNFLLNYLYIPDYSYIAASWVTVICEYVILSLQLFILIRYFKTVS